MKRPELFSIAPALSRREILADALAGGSLVVLTLPLAVAFAMASGMTPASGLAGAVLGCLIVSAFGGGRFQIAGPSATFAVVLYSIGLRYGFPGIQLVSIMAGSLLIVTGLLGLGGLVHFIPYTMVTGYTAGAAVLIALTGVSDILGIERYFLPDHLAGKIGFFINSISSFDPASALVGLGTLVCIILWSKLLPRFPGSLPAIALATLAAAAFGVPVATIGSRYGDFSRIFTPSLPPLPDYQLLHDLIPKALPFALLIAVESLLSGAVADGMTGRKHNANTDLAALGLANIVIPLFGGIPVSISVERTTANIRSGASSPVSGVMNALLLFLITLCCAPLVSLIPIPALAAVLVHLAFRMIDPVSIRSVFRGQKSDAAVMTATFAVTVFLSLTTALGVGFLLSAFFFIKKMIDLASFSAIKTELSEADRDPEESDPNSVASRSIPPGAAVFEISGPLFFGSVQKFSQTLRSSMHGCRAMILRMRNTVYLDDAGIRMLVQLGEDCKKRGILLLISDIHTQPYMLACKSGLEEKLSPGAILGNLDEALAYAARSMVSPVSDEE
ncbi:STAS domain-containing protein [Treponema zuelzerae]|uniref:STAS domain-containing protein n=1 Tax=Teretinema zuelzerae TaxID=156 RepID=A0AAE3EKR2_9SPIR|nr:SulP family inorganic anion transporter [Teretinema zuelzerae]MCD1655298.1 STAS domain-containing protein [Teretinema zuelzerae]